MITQRVLPMKITVERYLSQGEDRRIIDGLAENAKKVRDLEPFTYFSIIARTDDGEFIGGMKCATVYGMVYVNLLFVEEKFRGLDVGTKLMNKVFEHAKSLNCRFVTLSTFDFEARPFYEKLGFKLEFERHGLNKDTIMYFLRKDLEN